jgi:hypothetical protein
VADSRWSEATIERGGSARLELPLPRGVWEISLQYDSTRPLALSAGPASGSSVRLAELPANLDYRGSAPFWAAGRIEVVQPTGGTVPAAEITATLEDPPLAGRLLGADSVAHLGALAATPAGGSRIGSDCRDYVDWYTR